MSYKLKKIDEHPSGKWSLYEVTHEKSGDLLETSPSTPDRLDATKIESRRKARVRNVKDVPVISEQTCGDLSW